MKRGAVVLIREPGTPAAKARPCVIVQRTASLAGATKVTVCSLTSILTGAEGQRPFVAPSADNGLRKPSEVEADWIYTHPVEYLGGVIGHLDPATMEQVDVALRRWLHL